jgi:succinoglycan biosynthesis protein ExoV
MKEFPELMACRKKWPISLMPYYQHVSFLDWEMIARESGLHIILPTWPLNRILQELAETELLISGAMHGCIAADIFRVPWARLRFKTHEKNPEVQYVKWMDWCASIEMPKYTVIKTSIQNHNNISMNSELTDDLLDKLNRVNPDSCFSLSTDQIYTTIKNKLFDAVVSFSKKYDITINKYRFLNF